MRLEEPCGYRYYLDRDTHSITPFSASSDIHLTLFLERSEPFSKTVSSQGQQGTSSTFSIGALKQGSSGRIGGMEYLIIYIRRSSLHLLTSIELAAEPVRQIELKQLTQIDRYSQSHLYRSRISVRDHSREKTLSKKAQFFFLFFPDFSSTFP